MQIVPFSPHHISVKRSLPKTGIIINFVHQTGIRNLIRLRPENIVPGNPRQIALQVLRTIKIVLTAARSRSLYIGTFGTDFGIGSCFPFRIEIVYEDRWDRTPPRREFFIRMGCVEFSGSFNGSHEGERLNVHVPNTERSFCNFRLGVTICMYSKTVGERRDARTQKDGYLRYSIRVSNRI